MKKRMAIMSTLVTIWASAASAATLGLPLESTPVLSVGAGSDVLELEFLDFGGATDLVVFGFDSDGTVLGTNPIDINIDLNAGFLNGDLADASGGIFIEDGAFDILFEADAFRFGSNASGEIEIQFTNILGDLESLFPFGAVGIITLASVTGDPLLSLADGDIIDATFDLFAVAAPIPLPGAAFLFAMGIGIIGLTKKYQQRSGPSDLHQEIRSRF